MPIAWEVIVDPVASRCQSGLAEVVTVEIYKPMRSTIEVMIVLGMASLSWRTKVA